MKQQWDHIDNINYHVSYFSTPLWVLKEEMEVLQQLPITMTEVFIAAVSTTKFEMNEEDLQFYRDQKAREIQEVRTAMEQLHEFGQIPKKERPLANHALLWKNLLILSKILGFQSDFAIIHQLRIPESILTQQLWPLTDLFLLKHYYPRTPIGTWDTVADHYYILMEGIVEKEIVRSSIAKCDLDALELSHNRMNSGSKFKKNNKKRFARTDEQIPICLNSKRSQGRNIDGGNCHFRSLTDVQMLQVNCISWKRYVADFKRLQQEYLMNFIRKKLNLSLNFDGKQDNNEGNDGSAEPFYSIVTLQRKTYLQFSKFDVLLLYMGEMLVTTPNYKIQISRGCVLNPATSEIFTVGHHDGIDLKGMAAAKSLSTVIKISVVKLHEYFKEVMQQKGVFVQLLKGLQENRRSKKQDEKIVNLSRAASLKSMRPNIMQKFNSRESSQEATKTIVHSPTKLPLCEPKLKLRQREKVIGLKSIENMVEKTAKAAQLKHIEYLKRAHLSQDHNGKQQEENSVLPEYIFKDCMRNIEAKNEILKQAVKMQKEKLKNDLSRRQNIPIVDPPYEFHPTPRHLPPDGSTFLKKRIKDIYVRTEGCEEMISLATSSQRPTATASTLEKSQTRETVGAGLKLGQISEKELYGGFCKWYTGSLGVMKKVQNGKIRRIKLK